MRLATEPATLAMYRTRLARNRETTALFDTPRFCRSLEAAYEAMIRRSEDGLPPESFSLTVVG